MYLALDISTSCTGYCVFSCDGKLLESNAIILNKEKNFFKKAEMVEQVIANLVHEYKITDVAIEESLQSFRPGLSSAKTLFTLSKFNGVVQYICHKFGMNIHSYNVNTARKLAGISVNRKSKLKTKDQVLIQVAKIETNLHLPKKILKSGPRKGTEIYEHFCYDIADAYVIGSAYYKDKNVF